MRKFRSITSSTDAVGYVGPFGEIVVDNNGLLRIQDNVTPGGHLITSGFGSSLGNLSIENTTISGNSYATSGNYTVSIRPSLDFPNTLSVLPTADNDIHLFESAINGGVTLGNYGNSQIQVYGSAGDDVINLTTVNSANINLTTTGNVNVAASNVMISGNLIPSGNVQYDLGTADNQWRHLYVSGNTIYINRVPLSIDSTNTSLTLAGNLITGNTTVISISDIAPDIDGSTPIWWNSAEGTAYVKYQRQWVEMSPTVIPQPNINPTFDSIRFGDNTVMTTAATPGLTIDSDGKTVLGGNLWIGTVNDDDSVLWAPDTSEYIGIWYGGYRDLQQGGYGPNVSITVGNISLDDNFGAGWPDGGQVNIDIFDKNWHFGDDGNLTLPAGGTINYSDGSNALIGGGCSAVTNQLLNNGYAFTLDTNGNIVLPTSGYINTVPTVNYGNGNNIVLTAGSTTGCVSVGGSITLNAGTGGASGGIERGGNVYINTHQGAWKFNSNGSLKLPDTGNIVVGGIAQVGSELTIATDIDGFLIGWGTNAVSVAYNADIISTYSVGSTITFQDGRIRTITQIDNGGFYIDIFWDYITNESSDILFPITLQTSNYVAAVPEQQWTFGLDGTLTVPGRITSSGNVLQIGSDSNPYGSVQIETYNGPWTFGNTGNLIAPYGYLTIDSGYESGLVGLVAQNTQMSTRMLYSSGNVASEIRSNRPDVPTAGYPPSVQISLYDDSSTPSATTWTFGLDGNLTLPSGGTINWANGSNALVGGSSAANTGNVTFNDINIIGTGNLKLQPDLNNSGAYLDVYLTTGPDIHIAGSGENVILGRDSGANVTVGVDGNVSIQADVGTPHVWTFGSDGVLTLPNGGLIANIASLGAGLSTGFIDANGIVVGTGYANDIKMTPGSDTEFWVNGNEWLFGADGNLTLPTGGQIMSAANAGNVVINANDGTQRTWTFNGDGSLQLPDSHGYIGRSGYTNGLDLYNNTNSTGYVRMNYNDQSYVWIDPAGAHIQTSGLSWTFGTDGSLSLPGSINSTSDAIFGHTTVGEFDANGIATFAENVEMFKDLYVHGNINFTGNVTQNTVTVQQGIFTGENPATGFSALYAGILQTPLTFLPATVFQLNTNSNEYTQMNYQNLNGGNVASAEYVITADNGTDLTGYIDMGIAGSGWDGTQSNSLGTAVTPNDGWIYVQNGTGTNGGHLVLGATSLNKKVKIVSGGASASNVVAEFSATGLSVPGTITSTFAGNLTGNVTGRASTVTNGVYTTDTGTVTNTMLAGSIANNKLANSNITINGISVALGGSVTTTTAYALITPTNGGTLTLDSTSSTSYIINNASGVTSYTVRLPDTTTISSGASYTIVNKNAYSVTIANSAGTFVGTLPTTMLTTYTNINNASNVVGSWQLTETNGTTGITGSGSMVFANSPTVSGINLNAQTLAYTIFEHYGVKSGNIATYTATPTAVAASGVFTWTNTGQTYYVGQTCTVTGTNGGTGVISGYSSGTVYSVINAGVGTVTLAALGSATSITTTAGTISGLTFTFGATVTGSFVTDGPIIHVTGTVSSNFHVYYSGSGLATFPNAGSVTVVVNQGATPYIPSSLNLWGYAQNVIINWQNGVTPTGNASKKDVFTFTFLAASSTPYSGYTVLGSMSTFG